MMVLDASAAINAASSEIVEDENSELLEFLDTEKFIAPSFFGVEAANSAWKFTHAGLFPESETARMMATAVGHIDEFFDDEELVGEAFSEAVRLDHPVYDMLYFVLARRKGVKLATADKKLAKLCEENGVECVRVLDL